MNFRLATVSAVVVFTFGQPVLAGPPPKALRKLTPVESVALFCNGNLDCGTPFGAFRSAVLSADGKLPQLKARLQGSVWKGKTFHGDGTFTNRWLGGIAAGTANVSIEPSWLDGRDCVVLIYPPSAPVFRNVRDELRQIAPDTWLGHTYDTTTGRSRNWFLLWSK